MVFSLAHSLALCQKLTFFLYFAQCTAGTWICAGGYYKTASTCTACPTDYTSSPGSTNLNQCFVSHGVQINAKYWLQNQAAVTERFNSWILK